MNSTGKQVIVLPKFGLLDPVTYCVTGRLCNLELDRSRGLMLHHGGAGRNTLAMADVAHAHFYEVTSPQLAVQPQVKHGEFTNSVLKLKTDPNGPNLFQFERRLLSDDYALVPGIVLYMLDCVFHGGLHVD